MHNPFKWHVYKYFVDDDFRGYVIRGFSPFMLSYVYAGGYDTDGGFVHYTLNSLCYHDYKTMVIIADYLRVKNKKPKKSLVLFDDVRI